MWHQTHLGKGKEHLSARLTAARALYSGTADQENVFFLDPDPCLVESRGWGVRWKLCPCWRMNTVSVLFRKLNGESITAMRVAFQTSNLTDGIFYVQTYLRTQKILISSSNKSLHWALPTRIAYVVATITKKKSWHCRAPFTFEKHGLWGRYQTEGRDPNGGRKGECQLSLHAGGVVSLPWKTNP